jgi:HSP20 family molecular chaperone IbpA
VEAKYAQHFAVDESTVNTSKVQFKFENGFLTIQISKKEQPKPVTVGIAMAYPPEDTEHKEDHTLTLDLPHVKASHLKVDFRYGHIFIDAEPKRGKKVTKINRRFSSDKRYLEVTQLGASLADGVLTITAPLRASSKDPSMSKNITVSAPSLTVSKPLA